MERVTPLPVKSAGAVLNEGARFARNTDWNLFKIFRQIAQSESIGGAARRLNRQQPTVTAALQRLESHIGLKLCERTHKGIVLTQFGKRVQSICEEIEASLSSIPEAALAARATASDPISVKVISNLHLIPRLNSIFSEFHARLPDTEIKLDTAPWRSVVHAVTAGEADIGIGFIGDGAAPARRLLVLDQVQQLYCGPSHRLLGAAGADIADLQHEPLVISHDEPYENRRFRTVHRLGDAIGGISDNLDERMWLIQLGLGIGFLPSTVVEASPFANKLWRLVPDAVAPVCSIYVMRSPQRMQNAGSEVLWDIATRHLQPPVPG
jgi:DNA-binding transcriptional LysR family regulator